MAHSHLLSACAFCFVCLVHIHCSEHSAHVIKAKVADGHDRTTAAAGEPPRPTSLDGAEPTSDLFEHFLQDVSYTDRHHHARAQDPRRSRRHKNSAVPIAQDEYVDKLFEKFQNEAKSMDLDGFKKLLTRLGVPNFTSKERKNSSECIDAKSVIDSLSADQESESSSNFTLSKAAVVKICPLLLYSIVEPSNCHDDEPIDNFEDRKLATWLYATGSVALISLCGLFVVLVIPIMGTNCYQYLLQFLVALAVGTLCGDALLHLMPHALVTHTHGHHDHHENEHDQHTGTMWKGLGVLSGILFFFLTEKLLMLGTEWRKKQQRSRRVQGHSHVKIMNGTNPDNSVDKTCKHKYSSYPYCYPDIKNNKDGHDHGEGPAAGQELLEGQADCGKKADEYDVIVTEHTSSHHGHSHSHGHVHSAPGSFSSVAWMVILGDGLHNFTDGLALGAAFGNNIAGGCSTAVAVFCHELPHELGDFAMLLKTGMSAKQAILYNLLSSVLCFFGMAIGLMIGSDPQVSAWVFAVSAGTFLYIALVDMFPELTTNHSTVQTSLLQCCLQGLGLTCGVAIMLVIAYYEDQLLIIFG